ncbi:hypothetical protein EDD69_1205 [Thermolongibacillus altinsuensis]|uniref:DUF4199 domain-containing protein n=1 Tax=Thermolongibacillus altinsuensis TaxID=575256 RepID=A0A4R1QCY6_9BACL|nr:hypothetical protein [Thermolongibacillus altinsuensis]TCL45660.1 hypothetical protein EDD69_1205 [Thermolongibacillus altinsuensis]GMB08368.1 hypothetical protein B1no1_10780 [Thermolongibacillus altinsuensis]
MKKIIGLIVVITTILLFVTKSLYVEWAELFIIIGSLSVISIIFNKQQIRFSVILGSSAIIGFLFCLVFGLIDLIADHFMYFLPTGNEDGMPLTLGMKINEYSDDLFVASLISMISVLTISILASLILKFTTKNHKVGF